MLIRHGIQGRARGHVAVTGPGGTVEHETFTCAHCQKIVTVKPRATPGELGGRCHNCDAMVCPGCARVGRCTPFEKRIEEYEARMRLRKQVG
jgi:hypothetical protein